MMTKFFASSNSYNGFFSLFNDVFDSKKFDKVFVLKGGPGTGKSTLIKNIAKYVYNLGGAYTSYYCSSDVDSLDGIIITLEEKRFAIIDGTAPHERDAVYVGAIDEIVNLSDGLDVNWIYAHKEEIIDLSIQKSKAYKAAYRYLGIAGKCYEEIYKAKLEKFNYNSAIKYINNLNVCSDNNNNHTSQRKFISSFNKDGYTISGLDTNKYTKTLKIGGEKTNTTILLNSIYQILKQSTIEEFPSPLDPKALEGITTYEKLYITQSNDEHDISSDVFFDISKKDEEEIRNITKVHDDMICEASRWLHIASDIHFRLEDIYVHCMNFNHNQVIFDKICKKILKACDYQN